jgi:hypothetical protein
MPTNALLIKHENGWAERTASASPERIEGLLAIGAITSLPEVYRVADGQLAVFANPREQITLGLSPIAAKVPYSGLTPGDTITVPLAAGGTGTERVQSVSVTEQDGGDEPSFTLLVKDTVLEAEEAFDQAVKKMSNGTLGGGAVTAQPAVPTFIGSNV